MRKLLLVLLLMGQCCWALERQPNADYHARREALAKETNGNVVVLFAPMEAEGLSFESSILNVETKRR